MCWIPNPSTSPNSRAEFLILYLFWWRGIYRSNQVKVRSLVWTPIKYNWCPYEKGYLDIGMCIERWWCEDMGKRETWNRSFSQSTDRTSSASPLISDIQLPELWEYPQFVIHILLWQPSQTNTASMNSSIIFYITTILWPLTTVILVYQCPSWNLMPWVNTLF